jgi:hypothetical protein
MVYRFHKPKHFDVRRYLESAFTHEQSEAYLRRSIERFPPYEATSVCGALLRFLSETGQEQKIPDAFSKVFLRSGVRHNFMLGYELLPNAKDCVRLLYEQAKAGASLVGPSHLTGSGAVLPRWPFGLIFPVGGIHEPTVLSVKQLPCTGGRLFAFHLSADACRLATRVHVRAVPSAGGNAVFDQHLVLLPGEQRCLTMPLLGANLDLEIHTTAASNPQGDTLVFFAPSIIQ